MTTIVYHDGVMACDRRVTLVGVAKGDRTVCNSCGDHTPIIEQTDEKIVLFDSDSTSTFMNEEVVAVGMSGNMHLGQRLITSLKKGRDIEVMIDDYYFLNPTALPSTFLLIVTKEHAYTFEVQSDGTDIHRFSLKDAVVIGKGGMAAMTAIKFMNADPVSAIVVASEIDLYTGNGIMKVNLRDPNPKIKRVTPEEVMQLSQGNNDEVS
jgi:hypothetical protein